jgi:hypothetical protein
MECEKTTRKKFSVENSEKISCDLTNYRKLLVVNYVKIFDNHIYTSIGITSSVPPGGASSRAFRPSCSIIL